MKSVSGNELLKRQKAGVDELVNNIKLTIGPAGRNAIFYDAEGKVEVTNDGVTIAQKYHVGQAGSVEAQAADVVRKVSLEANDLAGDGTTTAAILSQAIFAEAYKLLRTPWYAKLMFGHYKGVNPMNLRDQLLDGLEQAERNLRSMTTDLTKEQMEAVATVSVGGDKDMGKLISDAIKKVGTGPVTVEQSPTPGRTIDIIRGHVAGGIATPHLNTGKTYNNVLTFVFKNEVSQHSLPLEAINNALADGTTEIAFIAPSFTAEALAVMIINARNKVFTSIPLITSDGEDTAEVLGAKIATADAKLEDAVTASKILVSEDKSVIIAGNAAKTKVAVIKLGYSSDLQYREQAKRVEDAINAVRAAQEMGVVPGGGVALLESTTEVGAILTKAMRAPFEQIIKNGAKEPFSPDVIDPLKVTLTALRQAVTGVSTLITSGAAIYEEDVKND